jgi:phosphoglycolate phosphatase
MFRILRPDITESQIEHGMKAFRTTYESVGIKQNRLYPGVPRMLGAIAARGDVAWVVTSKPERYAIQVAELLGLDRQVMGVIGAGLDELDTKTSLIARALVEAGAERRRAVMVGDRHYDVVGAIENGIRPIGVLWGYGSFDELRRAGCRDFAQTVDDFRERYVESKASARGNRGIRRSPVTQA